MLGFHKVLMVYLSQANTTLKVHPNFNFRTKGKKQLLCKIKKKTSYIFEQSYELIQNLTTVGVY